MQQRERMLLACCHPLAPTVSLRHPLHLFRTLGAQVHVPLQTLTTEHRPPFLLIPIIPTPVIHALEILPQPCLWMHPS